MSHNSEAKDEISETNKHHKSKKRYLYSGLFLVTLICITFYIIFKDHSIDEIYEILKTANPIYVLLGILSTFGFIFFQGLTYGLATRCIGSKLRFREMMQYSFIGFFYSAITPSSTGGQPVQFYYMTRDRMPLSSTTLVLFIGNITYQLTMVILGLIMFFPRMKYILGVNHSFLWLFTIGILFNFMILVILLFAFLNESLLRRFLMAIAKFLNKIKIVKDLDKATVSINKYISELHDGISIIRSNIGIFLIILVVSAAMVICNNLAPYFVYRAFGNFDYTLYDFLSISIVLFMSVSFLPIPGTVGASESGFVMLFKKYFGGTIVPCMLLSRFMNFYVMLIISGIVSAFVQLRKPYDLSTQISTLNK